MVHIFHQFYTRFECASSGRLSGAVVFSCALLCGGLADRLKGVLTALVLALLTRRRLYVDMTHPLPIGLMLGEGKVRWGVRIHSFRA